MSGGVSSVCLIERCVVNCLCVGGEKSICFLTAMTSRPWGERLKLAQTHTHTIAHTQTMLPKNPKPCLACRKLRMQCHGPSLLEHTPQHTPTHTCRHRQAHSLGGKDVHERLLSQGEVRCIYRSAACWGKSQERETCTGQRAKRQ